MVGVSLTTVIIPLLAVLFAPLLAYFGVAKRLSGKIATSEAKDLWAESTKIREDYRGENVRLQDRIDRLESRVDTLDNENQRLRFLNDAFEERIKTLEAENARLSTWNDKCEKRIAELETRLRDAGKSTNGS